LSLVVYKDFEKGEYKIVSQEKMIDKLKKLLKHKESAEAIGSMAEAEAFAARITALLSEYKLEMADIQETEFREVEEDIEKEYVDLDALGIGFTDRRDTLMSTLANIVAKANFCVVIGNGKGNGFMMIGKKTDRQIATYIFHVLYRYSREEAERQYRAQYYQHKLRGTTYLMKGFKKSFLHGFNMAIAERLKKQEEDAQYTQAQGLVLYNQKEAVQKWIKQNLRTVQKQSAINVGNSNARQQGYSYGKSVSLNSGIAAGKGGVKQIG
jgi:tRNA nucleotidyltransferase/poly(A) polymerase